MADYFVKEESLIAVADAIREKTGETAELSFPADFILRINALNSGSNPGGEEENLPNGREWTQSHISNMTFRNIHSDNGLWVACSENGLYYSENGITWAPSNVTSSVYNSAYYGNGLWVAGGTDCGLWYSSDGKAWTQSSITTDTCNDVYYAEGYWEDDIGGTYSEGYWVATVDSGILYSTDGTTWEFSTLTTPEFTNITDAGGIFGKVRYGGGHWVAISKECQDSRVSSAYGTAYSTFDGDVEGGFWRECYIYGGGSDYSSKVFDRYETLNDVHYAEGLWVLAGPKSTGGLYYVDDENVNYGDWYTATMDVPSGFNCVHNGNGLWVAGAIDNGLYYSQDGMTWTQSAMKTGSFTTVHYAEGMWIAGSANGTYYSEDGINWTQSTGLSSAVKDIYNDGTVWVAATENTGLYYSKSAPIADAGTSAPSPTCEITIGNSAGSDAYAYYYDSASNEIKNVTISSEKTITVDMNSILVIENSDFSTDAYGHIVSGDLLALQTTNSYIVYVKGNGRIQIMLDGDDI